MAEHSGPRYARGRLSLLDPEAAPARDPRDVSPLTLFALFACGLATFGVFWIYNFWLNPFAFAVLLFSGACLAYLGFLGARSAVVAGLHHRPHAHHPR